MKSYITGSRAYGTPREDSDIDLVIAVNEHDYRLLWAFADKDQKRLDYGKLNLVAFNLDLPEESARFERWLKVHESLVARKPVTKDEAIAAFREADAEKGYVIKELIKQGE